MANPKWHEDANFNLQDIHTPVKADELKLLLSEAGYPKEKIQFLHQGFKFGFPIGFWNKQHQT